MEAIFQIYDLDYAFGQSFVQKISWGLGLQTFAMLRRTTCGEFSTLSQILFSLTPSVPGAPKKNSSASSACSFVAKLVVGSAMVYTNGLIH